MKLAGSFVIWIIPWCILIVLGTASLVIPNSYWIEYRKFHVEDTNQGDIPKVTIDKTYHRQVYVYWTMVVYRSDKGRFWPSCRISGEDLRKPGFAPEDLSWWFDGDTKCIRDLIPGDYYVQEIVRWQVAWELGRMREISMDSNIFTIRNE